MVKSLLKQQYFTIMRLTSQSTHVSPFKSVFTNGEIFDSKNKDSRMRDVSRLIVRSLIHATYVLYLQMVKSLIPVVKTTVFYNQSTKVLHFTNHFTILD